MLMFHAGRGQIKVSRTATVEKIHRNIRTEFPFLVGCFYRMAKMKATKELLPIHFEDAKDLRKAVPTKKALFIMPDAVSTRIDIS